MGKQLGTGIVIAVFGPFSAVGGPTVGRTTIAANLAVALAQTGQRVALVDLDYRFGDLSLYMDVAGEQGTAGLLAREQDVTRESVQRCLQKHATGVSILAASRFGQRSEEYEKTVRKTVGLLAKAHDAVILDTIPSTFVVTLALRLATTVLFVTTGDLAALKSAQGTLDALRNRDCPLDRIKLIVNAIDESTSPRPDEIERVLGHKVFWSLPYDHNISAAPLGTPLVVSNPDSEAAKSIARLARLLAGDRVQSASEGSADAPEQAKAFDRDAEDWTLEDIWGEPMQSPKPFVPALRMHREIVRAWIQLSEFPGFDWKDLFENAGTQDPTQNPEWHINFHDLVEGYARKEAAWNAAFQALMEQAQAHQPTEISARHTAQHALIKILLLILVGKARPGHEAKLREAEDWLRCCAEQKLPEVLARIVRNPVSHDYTIVMRRPG